MTCEIQLIRCCGLWLTSSKQANIDINLLININPLKDGVVSG